jgi:hypothetical protein
MNASHATAAVSPVTPPAKPSLIDGLVDALHTERRLVEELTAVMLRQRACVAAEDLQGVEDSVFAVQRILFTLGEARKRRRQINVRLGQDEDTALHTLVEALGARASEALVLSRASLQESARALAREVATNRQVLREALSAGDAYVRALTGVTGGPAPRLGYGESLGTSDRARAPHLVNRRA